MAQDVICQRLEAALAAAGISQAELARLSGIDRGSISLYLSGRYRPKADKLLRLAEALSVSPQWLSGVDDTPEQNTDVRLPVYCGLTAEGALQDTGETDAVPREWLTEGAEFFLLRVTGLAMYPRLLEGDLLLVRRDAAAAEHTIAVLVQNGALLIRRVQGGQLLPANPEFPPHPLHPDAAVLGRAIRLIRTLS